MTGDGCRWLAFVLTLLNLSEQRHFRSARTPRVGSQNGMLLHPAFSIPAFVIQGNIIMLLLRSVSVRSVTQTRHLLLMYMKPRNGRQHRCALSRTHGLELNWKIPGTVIPRPKNGPADEFFGQRRFFALFFLDSANEYGFG